MCLADYREQYTHSTTCTTCAGTKRTSVQKKYLVLYIAKGDLAAHFKLLLLSLLDDLTIYLHVRLASLILRPENIKRQARYLVECVLDGF